MMAATRQVGARLRGALTLLFVLLIGGCDPNVDDSAIFTPANRYPSGTPATAKTITPEEFARGVRDGSLKMVTQAGIDQERRERQAQFNADRAFVEAIPQAERSALLTRLLDQANAVQDPFAEPTMTAQQVGGKSTDVVLLSPAASLHQAVYGYQASRRTENALNAYRMAYAVSPAEATAGLPAPDTLGTASGEQIAAARARLEAALGAQQDLDGVGPALPMPAPERTAGENRIAGDDPAVSKTATPGADGPTPDCAHDPAGVYVNINWPLKQFLSPTKDQGHRGACWAFAAAAALESAAQVTDGTVTNLSEQHFFHTPKFAKELADSEGADGYSSESALDADAKDRKDTTYPDETAWRYNPSVGRSSKDSPLYTNACNDYSGVCSPSVHQASLVCATAVTGVLYCAYQKESLPGGGAVKPIATTNVWTSGDELPIATLRKYLAGGQVLLASFDVYSGFDDAGGDPRGVISDLNTKKTRGGHETIIVGFITNAELKSRLPNIPQASGEGYFILKNSWGCAADGGYYLVPSDYISASFWTLSVLNLPTTRSDRWKSGGAPQGPKLTITAPGTATSGSVSLAPTYVDFLKPITFSARADDAMDGANCCTGDFIWKSAKQVALLGTGPTISAMLARPADTVTVSTRDSKNNPATASLMLADAYPIVTFTKPLARSPAKQNVPIDYAVNVRSFGLNTPLDCAKVSWKASAGAKGGGTGCAATYAFYALGTNIVRATYIDTGREVSAEVEVVVGKSSSGPPVVTLSVPQRADTLQQNAVVSLSIYDPAAPTDTDISKYALSWEVETDGVRKPISPAAFLGRKNQALIIPSKALTLPACSNRGTSAQTIKVYLTATNPSGVSATGSTSYAFTVLGCVK